VAIKMISGDTRLTLVHTTCCFSFVFSG